jgi:hypothetical protein
MIDFTRPRPGAALGFEESNFYLKASFFIAWRTDKEPGPAALYRSRNWQRRRLQ